jgi:ABC-type proline/glycine betaine transport system permease subunit
MIKTITRLVLEFIMSVVAIAIGVFLGVWAFNNFLIYF